LILSYPISGMSGSSWSVGQRQTTIARELFAEHIVGVWDWPNDRSILDAFPVGMSIKDIVGLLSSVGFSSPPSWCAHSMCFPMVSSFASIWRAHWPRNQISPWSMSLRAWLIARVAQIGSAAIAKTVRRRGHGSSRCPVIMTLWTGLNRLDLSAARQRTRTGGLHGAQLSRLRSSGCITVLGSYFGSITI